MHNLKNYIAKTNLETLEQHNNKLQVILDKIIDIYNIDKSTQESLKKSIKYHDIGKVSDSMQNRLKGDSCNFIRHEWVGASVADLKVGELLAILTHHKEISKSVEMIDNEMYKNELQEVSNKLCVNLKNISKDVKRLCKPSNKDIKKLENILLKGYLNYCDHLGSAGIKDIDKGFNAYESFRFSKHNSIQKKAMNTKQDTLIMAMTGLGKTATSMLWSDNMQNIDKSKRIYYILPFTASINSLYKDMENRHISVAMLHSKAEYFLNKLDEDIEYRQLKYSTKQVNICTIFQLAKAMFSCKRFEMLLAQMKNSIIIVDEIHCFDMKVLSYTLELLRWLKDNLGVSICIMSASIPTCLQNLIKNRLGITNIILAENYDLIERHKIHRVNKTILDHIDIIRGYLDNGKRVIVCVNNVNTSQKLFKIFNFDYNCKLIHGRFNTRDRELAEQGIKTSQLLIGTQAIEVSLDISYDVMFTESAPWDALLQRFGRINRKGEKGVSDIFIYDNYNKCIYPDKVIENTDEVISKVIIEDDRIIKENKVNRYLDIVYPTLDLVQYNEYKVTLNNIINSLRVGNYNKNTVEDMISSDTMAVVPNVLLEEYIELINNKEYLKAESLKVNIRKRTWDENIIYNKDFNIYICEYKYDENIGLTFEKTEIFI